jgi:hypothetical protein
MLAGQPSGSAKKIVQDKFDRNYRFQDEVTLATGLADTNEVATAKNIFDNLLAFHMVMFGTLNELSCYLSTMPEDVKNKDILKWWYEHKHVVTASMGGTLDGSLASVCLS